MTFNNRQSTRNFPSLVGTVFCSVWLMTVGGWCGSVRANAPGDVRTEYHPGRILIQARPGVRGESLASLHGTRKVKVLISIRGQGALQLVPLEPGESVPVAIKRYEESGLVVFAEPDYARHLALTPNDPKYTDGTLWGLNNYGQGGGTPDADIDAPEAWDIRTSASNIVVAVLDTGIRRTHEDLAANVWTNSTLGGFGWNALAGTTSPADDEGHGSLVSGVLGAVGNNGKGVTGVAWSVQIMAGKCFNSQRLGYDSDIIVCIDFARTNGAKVINASLGAYAYSQSLSNAIFEARQAGIIFVASSGNDGNDIDANPYYPAGFDIDNIVSVGFTTRDDTADARSNYGAQNVDLMAPGASMYSTFFAADNSYLGGSFLYGSSLAAPYVTGAFALALAKFPGETHQQIIQRVLGGVDRFPSLSGKCVTGGRLNLRNALSAPILLSPLSATGVHPFQFRVSSSPNRSCIVESSPDLATWTPVFTNTTAGDGTIDYADTDSGGALRRFYRGVSAQ